ncbi:MAG TPA: PadR family transcriptional regulator [Verrucomicrobiae bacterium]|nr:PadR family transcriptional regulator [Verrucomicrobiae bacterium]
MSRNAPGFLPQVSFSILLALSLQPRHGYELMQQIEEDSHGKLQLGPGALYGAIHQLHDEGLIEELPVESDHERRRYYRLTTAGAERLGAELEYFETSVTLARERRVFDGMELTAAWLI